MLPGVAEGDGAGLIRSMTGMIRTAQVDAAIDEGRRRLHRLACLETDDLAVASCAVCPVVCATLVGRIGQGRQSNPDVVSYAHPRSTLE